MSFPRYPAYKDSGVEWLGNVPAHWCVMSLVRDIEFITSGARGWAENYSDDGDLFIRIGNLTRDSINLDLSDVQRVVVPASAEVDRTQVRSGDVLFSITAYLGSVAVVPPDLGIAFVSQHVALVRPKQRQCISAWIGYVAISHVGKTHLETKGYGGTKVQLSLADVTTMPVLVPPKDEQSQLVGFLDRETAKIDALVAEQEQLITLLKEKRQAVISHAVTKGLDPSVPMKDSGVEWLGEVPAHWDVRAIKHIVATPITDGPHETPAFPDEGIPFVSAEAVSSGVIDFDRIRGFISAEDHARYSLKYKPKRGDIFMVKSGATTGVTAMVETDADFSIWSPLAVIRAASFMAPNFVLQFMRSLNFQEAVTLNWSFGTQQNIGMGVIENLSIAVPALAEQEAISDHLKQLLNQFQPLISEAAQAVQLLQERRSALISAAVTGQIDVRGLAPAQAHAA